MDTAEKALCSLGLLLLAVVTTAAICAGVNANRLTTKQQMFTMNQCKLTKGNVLKLSDGTYYCTK